LTSTVAALVDVLEDDRWAIVRNRLLAMCDLVHEMFAVGLSLITTQRRLAPIDNYPTYDRHVRTAQRLIGQDTHPWIAIAALRAAATACMQSHALATAARLGLSDFEPSQLVPAERPNNRLAALLTAGFVEVVSREESAANDAYGQESWWSPAGDVVLPPESMDGTAAEASARLHHRLLRHAESMLRNAGGCCVDSESHHEDLRALLAQARTLAPDGLTRIGALVEAPGGDLLHSGPLDGQIIELASAPARAVILLADEISGLSGEHDNQHTFVVLTTPRRLRAAFQLEGRGLPEAKAVVCLRSTVLDGDRRDSVLLVPVAGPEALDRSVPIFVCVLSSAAAADPEQASSWMQWADPDRVALVMDTPATAALRRWCEGGATFRTATRLVSLAGGEEIRIIAGRVEQQRRRSALVIIPSTEFGARWFEAARAEDPVLGAAIVEDPSLFEKESALLDIVLGHLLLEERFVGTGSWRR